MAMADGAELSAYAVFGETKSAATSAIAMVSARSARLWLRLRAREYAIFRLLRGGRVAEKRRFRSER